MDADHAGHAEKRGQNPLFIRVNLCIPCSPRFSFIGPTGLARIIHEASAAAVDPGMSAALRSVGFLSVLSSTPAESSRRAG